MFLYEQMFTYVRVSKEAREGISSPGAGVTGDCELPDVGGGPLEEQQALLTAEPPSKRPSSSLLSF